MRMKGKELSAENALVMNNSREEISMSDSVKEMAWDNSVVKVVFKDEQFVKKYKSKIEQFFKELLDEGENFITEHEFESHDLKFQIDEIQMSYSECNAEESIPLSIYDDVLHQDEPVVEKEIEENKPQAMTCFNCLGDHHMKDCTEKLDRMRIANNKKDLMPANTIRYHEEERKNAIKPGCPSEKLRNALDLKSDQLPRYIYNMRVIGYPPGWMQEAVFETSGLSLYDSEGNGSPSNDSSNILSNKKHYDSEKFIDYPGFNSSVPDGFKDEWQTLGYVPIQQHQLLSEALKSQNTISSKNMYKRKNIPSTSCEEIKKSRCGSNDLNESEIGLSPQHNPTPKHTSTPNHPGPQLDQNVSDSPISQKRLSLSISKSPGTPVVGHGNPYQKLPDADKFSQDITEHLPFENLPDAVGKFDNMRNVLSTVQKKLQNINRG